LEAKPIEFIEMICRIAKEACLPPKPTKKDEYGELIIDEVSLEER
jgi:hypothetical protein